MLMKLNKIGMVRNNCEDKHEHKESNCSRTYLSGYYTGF